MSPGFRHDDLPIDPQRNVHGPPPLGVGHGDCLGHIVGIVGAVLARLKSQPGAVAKAGKLSVGGTDVVPPCLACPHGAAPHGGSAKGGTHWLWHPTGLSAASDSSSIHSPLTQSASPPAMISSFACVVLWVPSPTQARTLGRAYRNPGRARSTRSGGGSKSPNGR